MGLTGLTPILNVSDVAASLAWFEGLRWKRSWTYDDGGHIEGAADANEYGPANFAAVLSGESEIFLCRNGQDPRGMMPRTLGDEDTGGAWMSRWPREPAEVDAFAPIRPAAWGRRLITPTNEPWGMRECRTVHPEGHTFRVSAPLPCPPDSE